MKQALIIEDDPSIAELVCIHLKDLGFEVRETDSGKTGLSLAQAGSYDLLILDLMLPDMDGVDIARQLRMEKVRTPIIMLTARSEEIDKVLGLETGADDYITKPFSVREFKARVKAVMRRTQPDSEPETKQNKVLNFEGLEIQVDNRIVRMAGERVELTPKEFDLLVLLGSHPGRSYSRGQLLQQVWGYDFEGYEHTVNSHINRLRSKIEGDPSDPKYILTTWGVGYRFNDQI